MDLKELQDFIKFIVRSGATEVEVETEDLKLSIKTPSKGKAQHEQPIIQQVAVPQQTMGVMPAAQMPATVLPQQQNMANIEQVANTAKKEEVDSNYITIKAPMVGTFYRKPAPNKPDFANVGDNITPGKVVCIIEAMKLFNEIEAEVSGKIVKILVDDATPVEFDQALFLIDPS